MSTIISIAQVYIWAVLCSTKFVLYMFIQSVVTLLIFLFVLREKEYKYVLYCYYMRYYHKYFMECILTANLPQGGGVAEWLDYIIWKVWDSNRESVCQPHMCPLVQTGHRIVNMNCIDMVYNIDTYSLRFK